MSQLIFLTSLQQKASIFSLNEGLHSFLCAAVETFCSDRTEFESVHTINRQLVDLCRQKKRTTHFQTFKPPNWSPGYENWDCKEQRQAETRLLPHTHNTLNTRQTHLRPSDNALPESQHNTRFNHAECFTFQSYNWSSGSQSGAQGPFRGPWQSSRGSLRVIIYYHNILWYCPSVEDTLLHN